jgi:hypothetical protein
MHCGDQHGGRARATEKYLNADTSRCTPDLVRGRLQNTQMVRAAPDHLRALRESDFICVKSLLSGADSPGAGYEADVRT